MALNLTSAGEHGVLTPRLIALQPAQFTREGKTVRPMGRETDKALEFVQALTDEQRKQAIHEAAAAEKMNEIEASLADTWFAWSGPLEAGKAYFRIQGPTIIIEFAPQRSELHLHSMYRDPTNDYGRKFSGR